MEPDRKIIDNEFARSIDTLSDVVYKLNNLPSEEFVYLDPNTCKKIPMEKDEIKILLGLTGRVAKALDLYAAYLKKEMEA